MQQNDFDEYHENYDDVMDAPFDVSWMKLPAACRRIVPIGTQYFVSALKK